MLFIDESGLVKVEFSCSASEYNVLMRTSPRQPDVRVSPPGETEIPWHSCRFLVMRTIFYLHRERGLNFRRGAAADTDPPEMSGAHEQNRKRRPYRSFLIITDLQVQDDLEGLVLLKRGFFCLEQDQGRTRRDALWVKVPADFISKLYA